MKAIAKKCMPRCFRMSYIPTWDENCQDFYKLYKEVVDPEEISTSASNLVNKLNQIRQARWKESISDIDFTHSSQKAWHNINKLPGRNSTKAKYPFSSNAIAKQVVANGIFKERDKNFTREMKREVLHMKMRPLLPEQET